MIFPVALYYLVVLPLFHFSGEGADTAPLAAFVVAFLAVFLASAWVECHLIGNLPFAWFVVKLALVVGAAAALFFSMATVAQLEDAALAVFALESVSALVTAFSHVVVEYQQVFVVVDEDHDPFTATTETVTFTTSPPVVVPVIAHHAPAHSTPQAPAPTAPSPPSPSYKPFDVEKYLLHAQLQYQLEVEAAKERLRRLAPSIQMETVPSHVTPVSPPVPTELPAVTEQPQAIVAATTAPPPPSPPPPPPSSPTTTSSPSAETFAYSPRPYGRFCVRTIMHAYQEIVLEKKAADRRRRRQRHAQRTLAQQQVVTAPVHDDDNDSSQISPTATFPTSETPTPAEDEVPPADSSIAQLTAEDDTPTTATSEASSPITPSQNSVPHVDTIIRVSPNADESSDASAESSDASADHTSSPLHSLTTISSAVGGDLDADARHAADYSPPPSLPHHAAWVQLGTQLLEIRVESQNPPSSTAPIDILSSRQRRNVRPVKSTKRERKFDSSATYTPHGVVVPSDHQTVSCSRPLEEVMPTLPEAADVSNRRTVLL